MSKRRSHLPYEQVSRHLEGRLSPTELPKVRSHLLLCGRCRSEVSWLERVREMMRAEPAVPSGLRPAMALTA
jgi:anti-sigma factor ChrR (cupin superfamily)